MKTRSKSFLAIALLALIAAVAQPQPAVGLQDVPHQREGAVEQARKEIASAEARTAEYEQKLREARAQIFKTQESYRKHVMDERARAIAEARKQAEQMIKSARQTVQQEVEVAKAGLDKQADVLADQVIQTVLKPAAAVGSR